jgi:hypothetical protein
MVCMATPNVWISKKSSEVLVAAEDPVIIGSSWARSTLPTRGSSGSTFTCALWASAVRLVKAFRNELQAWPGRIEDR